MSKNCFDKWMTVLFCAALGTVLALFLLLPQRSFSEREKRYLAEAPELSWESLFSGRFGSQAESYAADHLPGRELLVGLDARTTLLTGRQTATAIYRGRSGRLYEAPATLDSERVRRNMAAINDFADAIQQGLDLMLVPSAGLLLWEDLPPLADPYPDEEAQRLAEQYADDAVRLYDLLPLFRAAEDPGALFYRTDHHWTSRGAQLAAASYLQTKGRSLPPAESYAVTAYPGFTGTTYARAALWSTPAESLELWDCGEGYVVTNRDSEGSQEGLYYRQHLEESDKYPVYLDGNHSLVRVHNPAGQGRLLLIRDSFASCMACFLAQSYEETVLVDLRYYRGSIAELAAQESFDDILVLYGCANFLTDSNLIRLE